MKLAELIARAAHGYEDQALHNFFDPKTGETIDPGPSAGDTLGLFIVRELVETFEEGASDDAQIIEALHVMRAARNELDRVREALVACDTDEYVECVGCERYLRAEDSYSPGDEALCSECDTEVTGRTHKPEDEAADAEKLATWKVEMDRRCKLLAETRKKKPKRKSKTCEVCHNGRDLARHGVCRLCGRAKGG